MAPLLPTVGNREGYAPAVCILGGGGDWKGPPPYVFLGGGLSPKKDGGLSCAQSCRPASLRETGDGVSWSLVEVGVSGESSVRPSVDER
jgi:hypothetical protein